MYFIHVVYYICSTNVPKYQLSGQIKSCMHKDPKQTNWITSNSALYHAIFHITSYD